VEDLAVTTPGFWQDRPVLVTGVTGLLGGWLTHALLERNARVVGLVRDSVPGTLLTRSGDETRIAIVRGDIRDQELLERTMGEYEVRSVFHLAAQTIVGVANRNPVGTFESNVRGTWCLLEAARRSPTVSDVVVASSDKAYGIHDKLPYAEDAPLQGRFPYDASKSCADLIAQSYAASYDLPVCVTRCGNLFGGGDLNWNRVVPGTVRSLLYGERPVVRSDGQYVRDYLYAEDAALAYLTTAENLSARHELRGHAFNFSTESPLTVLEIVDRIRHLMQRTDLAPDVRNEARNEIPKQYLDATKARTTLSWQPHFGLDQGLSRTIAWYRDLLAVS
jgi:CDP-glucose 4,6-dehydratase